MGTYDSQKIENFSVELLRTKINHLSHDLDKTINTEMDPVDFKKNAENEIKKLKLVLKEWQKRKLPEEESIRWAKEKIKEAEQMISNFVFSESVSNKSNLEINYEEAKRLLRLIKSRRSVRSWLNRDVPIDVINFLLEAAIWAPSACNRQSVRYIILKSNEQKERLANLREKFLKRAPVLILIGVDKRNYFPEELDSVPYIDVGVAVQNLLLMAHAIGLGAVFVKCTETDIYMDSGWSGGPQREKMIKDMYSHLNLPFYFLPVGIIALGFPRKIPKAPPRLPLEKISFIDKFEYEDVSNRHGEIFKKNRGLIDWFFIKIVRKLSKLLGIRIYVTLE